MGMRKYVEHARHRQSLRSVDRSGTASGDSRRDDKAVCQSGYGVLGRVFCSPSNFRMPVDPGCRLAKVIRARAVHLKPLI